MANVYTKRFFARTGLHGTATAQVPAGFIWVMVNVDAYYNGLVEASIHVKPGGAFTAWYNGFGAGGNPQYASWRGRAYIHTMEFLTVTTDQAIDVSITGYQLALP